jgi:hypothetical protein
MRFLAMALLVAIIVVTVLGAILVWLVSLPVPGGA